MVVSIRLSDEEKQIATNYASKSGLTLNEAMKRAFFEKIEDEYDIAIFDAALKEHEKNPKTYSIDELLNELDS